MDCPSLPIRIAKTKSARFFEDEKLSGVLEPRDIVFEELPEPGEPSPTVPSGLTFPYPVEQPSAVETQPVVQGQGKPKQEPFPAVDAPHQAPPVGGKVALRRSKRERRPAISYDYVLYLHEDGTLVDDPVTFSQAIGGKDSSRWYDAIKEDMNSMDKNKVWLIRVA